MLDMVYCICEKCVKHYYYSNVVLFYRPVASTSKMPPFLFEP
nr:MAG TPA: hypothetical protein [Caudoviricetes sp.]DAS50691.1 MAG TPA: hypothetical protein [Caudoviricetes sp.]DAY27139.1 MAG TPA: hypothetical protein [Caudoviricetes sp.]